MMLEESLDRNGCWCCLLVVGNALSRSLTTPSQNLAAGRHHSMPLSCVFARDLTMCIGVGSRDLVSMKQQHYQDHCSLSLDITCFLFLLYTNAALMVPALDVYCISPPSDGQHTSLETLRACTTSCTPPRKASMLH